MADEPTPKLISTLWERFTFIVSNLKVITIAGAVFWILVVLTLQLLGFIKLETDCPACSKLLDLIPKASAATGGPTATGAPLIVRVTLLP